MNSKTTIYRLIPQFVDRAGRTVYYMKPRGSDDIVAEVRFEDNDEIFTAEWLKPEELA